MADSHNVAAAMARGELDEEEAYYVLRFAGRFGYREAMRRLDPKGPLSRARRWLVWIGGWESPELCRWDRGWPAWRTDADPTPVSLLGHLVTFYGWGAELRVAGGHLVYTRRDGHLYWSPDATPSHSGVVEFWPRRERDVRS